jgi:hypothetical protein
MNSLEERIDSLAESYLGKLEKEKCFSAVDVDILDKLARVSADRSGDRRNKPFMLSGKTVKAFDMLVLSLINRATHSTDSERRTAMRQLSLVSDIAAKFNGHMPNVTTHI